jgi:hypothetical protein
MSAAGVLRRLVRWRSFGESRAADALRASSAEAASAQSRADAAHETILAQQARRGELLAPGVLDLGLMHAAAQVEADARSRAEQREALLRMAREEEAQAREAHLQARARTRVAEGRRGRLAAQEQGRREKTDFDRVADAYQANVRRAGRGEGR